MLIYIKFIAKSCKDTFKQSSILGYCYSFELDSTSKIFKKDYLFSKSGEMQYFSFEKERKSETKYKVPIVNDN